jgi:hypothetical protein
VPDSFPIPLGLGVYALRDDPEEGDPGQVLSITAFENGYYGSK